MEMLPLPKRTTKHMPVMARLEEVYGRLEIVVHVTLSDLIRFINR